MGNYETTKIIKKESPREIRGIEKKLLQGGILPHNAEEQLPELINYYNYWYRQTTDKRTRIEYGTILYLLQTLQSYGVEKNENDV